MQFSYLLIKGKYYGKLTQDLSNLELKDLKESYKEISNV